jgi:hypothetical protein
MPSAPELLCVDPKRVHEIWPYTGPLVKAACRRTKLNAFADIEADVLSGRSLLWVAWTGRAINAAAATILINSEIGKVCVITVCSGHDMKRWLPLIGQIENYARNEDCARVRIYGRKGWLHVLEGYGSKYVIMDKELSRRSDRG